MNKLAKYLIYKVSSAIIPWIASDDVYFSLKSAWN
jgi:hypothetical protein